MKTALAILLLSASVVMGAPALPQRGLVQEFDTIAEALASNPSQLTDTYVIKGLNAINDGLAGKFYFLAGDTSDTNSTDCFAWSTGRLKRTFDGVTASQVLVFGSSTNKAGDLTIETNGYMRLLYVVPTLGSGGTAAVFDSTGMLTNGTGGTFVSTNGIFTNITVLNAIFLRGSNVAAMNPTDLYIPVRVSTNGFADSPLHVPAEGSSDVILNGSEFINGFGTHGSANYSEFKLDHSGTNGFAILDSISAGTAGSPVDFQFSQNGTGFLRVGRASTMSRLYPAGSQIGISLYDSGSRILEFFGGLFVPSTDIQLGTENRQWGDFYQGPAHFHYLSGFSDGGGLNYSRLALNHTGTNGAFVINSQAAGTAGSGRPIWIQIGGTNLYAFSHDPVDPYIHVTNSAGSLKLEATLGNALVQGGNTLYTQNKNLRGLLMSDTQIQPTVDNVISLAGPSTSTWFVDAGLKGTLYMSGFGTSGADYSRLLINHLGTNSSIFFDSVSAGTAGSLGRPFVFTNAPVYIHKNIGAFLNVGDTTFVDLSRASQTNVVSGAMTFAHATNGVHGFDLTHVRWLFNNSGSDQTLTIPSGWKTNVYSAVPPALTNATITVMYVKCGGPTSSSTLQTNCYVSFEYYK